MFPTAAAVSRSVAPCSWVSLSERHEILQQRSLRRCTRKSSLVPCSSSHGQSSSTGATSSSFSDSWGSSGSEPKLSARSSHLRGVAGVHAETSDETGSRFGGFSVGQVLVQGLRDEMEDDAVVVDGPEGFTYAAVFDGHEGYAAVEFLRAELYKECVEALQGGKLLESDDQDAVEDALVHAFHHTDTRLLSWLSSNSEQKRAGATATVLFLGNDFVTIAHVGDSRAVLSQGGKAVDLSGDHRPFGNSKTAMAEVRRVKQEGGWVHHGRLCAMLSVSRAFGDDHFKTKKAELIEDGIKQRLWTKAFADRFNLEGDWLSVTPDVSHIKLDQGAEFIIIASDGLWDSFKSNEAVQYIRKKLQEDGDVQKAAEAIAQATLERHGQDNISVIILYLQEVPQDDLGLKLKFW